MAGRAHKTGWPPEAGFRYHVTDRKDVKVMAVADGYVMARYMGCVPFAETIADFWERIRFGGNPRPLGETVSGKGEEWK